MVCTFQSPQKVQHVRCPGKGAAERVLEFYRTCVCCQMHSFFSMCPPFSWEEPSNCKWEHAHVTHIRVCIRLDNTRSECPINFNLNCSTSGSTLVLEGFSSQWRHFFGNVCICPSQNFNVIWWQSTLENQFLCLTNTRFYVIPSARGCLDEDQE